MVTITISIPLCINISVVGPNFLFIAVGVRLTVRVPATRTLAFLAAPLKRFEELSVVFAHLREALYHFFAHLAVRVGLASVLWLLPLGSIRIPLAALRGVVGILDVRRPLGTVLTELLLSNSLSLGLARDRVIQGPFGPFVLGLVLRASSGVASHLDDLLSLTILRFDELEVVLQFLDFSCRETVSLPSRVRDTQAFGESHQDVTAHRITSIRLIHPR